MKAVLTGTLILLLAGCTAVHPPVNPTVQTHIQRELQSASAAAAPSASAALPPRRVIEALLPPATVGLPTLLQRDMQPRFDLLLTDAPVEQVFATLVADTRYSVMLSQRVPQTPGVDRMTLHLKNVTVEEALESIREIYGFEYRIDGTRILVQRAALSSRLFRVDYILGQRRGVSDLQVIGGASSAVSGSGSGGTGASSGYASTQASALSSSFKTDLWGETEDSLRTLLGCAVSKATIAGVSAVPGAAAAGTQTRGSSGRADVNFTGDAVVGERQRGGEGCPGGRALSVNPTSGTILVRAMPDELRMVAALLKSMQLSIERQVIIEAKVVDVTLNAGAQQGINWAAFRDGRNRLAVGAAPNELLNASRGFVTADGSVAGAALPGDLAPNSTLGSLLGTGLTSTANGAFATGLGVAMQFTNFSALLNFLETQGRVHVLSSPRIATLNNQKAVLKVGAEEPFVTNIAPGTTNVNSNATVSTPPTLTYQPFFSGISLDVTPQISENGDIVLHVHSMVNVVVEKSKIASPAAGAAYVPFAVNSISQTDSVVRARTGQMVVIGGLMTERTLDQRARVPGVGEVPAAGALFSKGEQQSVKRELVILIKATVVEDETPWQDAIQSSAQRLVETPTPFRAPAAEPVKP
jgi:MSHA biogenesis protein MshL